MRNQDELDTILKALWNKGLHAQGYVSALGGIDKASILLTVSTKLSKDCVNGILENHDSYVKLHIDSKVSYISGPIKFRKCDYINPMNALDKILKAFQVHANKLQTKESIANVQI